MLIKIREDRNIYKDYSGTEGSQNENKVIKLTFDIPEELNDYNKRIVFITPDGNLEDVLTDNSYIINNAITKYKTVQAYIWLTSPENEDWRSKVFGMNFNYNEQSDEEEPTEEELNRFNTVLTQLNTAIDRVAEIEIEVGKLEDLKIQVETLEFKVVDLENIVLNFNGRFDKQDEKIQEIENTVSTYNEKIQTLEDNVKTYDNRITTNTDDITELNQEINNLNLIVDELDKDLTNVDNRVTALNEELTEQEETLNHLDDTKADKTEIPDVSKFVTKTVNDLTNYYLKAETYTQQEVNNLIGAIKTISMKLVPERPEVGQTNIIYLVPSKKTQPENIYDEYVYINDKWELIGSTEMDLSNYYTKEEINQLLFDYITSNDLEEILENYITSASLEQKLSDYALKTDIPKIEHATETHAGIIEIANDEETLQGVDDLKAVTPLKLKNAVDSKIENKVPTTIHVSEVLGNEIKQDTRSGKNIFNSALFTKKTINGVYLTYDTSDGSVTLNGTCTTDNTVLSINQYWTLNGKYTLSYEYVSGEYTEGSQMPMIQVLDTSNWQGPSIELYPKANNSLTKTFSNLSIGYSGIRADNGTSFDNYKIKIQLEKGDLSEYEPYGASPSPEYPSEVKAVKGNYDVKVRFDEQEQVYPLDFGNIELYKDSKIIRKGYKQFEIESKWGKIELTNTLNWIDGGGATGVKRYYSVIINKKVVPPDENTMLANAYSNIGIVTADNTYTGVKKGVAIHKNGSIYIDSSIKESLDNQEVYLIYELKEPTTTEITNETLLSQLEDIFNIRKRKEGTYIDVLSDDENAVLPILNIVEYKDIVEYVEDSIGNIVELMEVL